MLNIYSASLIDNKKTIEKCLKNLKKIYGNNFNYTIICPKDACSLFESLENTANLRVINEEKIISFSDFKNLTLDICQKISKKYNLEIVVKEERIGWYYQQALKLAYLFEESIDKPITCLDADTYLIRKIPFYNGESSNLFFKPWGKHKPYLDTMKTIFNLDVQYKSWESTTCQINSLTPIENQAILKKLEDFIPKTGELNTAEWITKIMITGVLKTHKKLNRSLFSEQDFIGFFLRYGLGTKPKNILFLREFITYKLTSKQEIIASILGFYHVTYESWLLKDKNKYMSWFNFFYVLIMHRMIPLKLKLKSLLS